MLLNIGLIMCTQKLWRVHRAGPSRKEGFPPDELHIASSSCDYRDVSQSRSPLSFCQEGIAGVGDLVLALSKARRFMSRLARA